MTETDSRFSSSGNRAKHSRDKVYWERYGSFQQHWPDQSLTYCHSHIPVRGCDRSRVPKVIYMNVVMYGGEVVQFSSPLSNSLSFSPPLEFFWTSPHRMMAASPAIDCFVSIFHDGNLSSREEAHSALDILATCIVDNDFEPFLNKLLDPSCHTTPLALELILSCKHCSWCNFTSADWFTSHRMRTAFCQLVADSLPTATQRLLFVTHGLYPYKIVFLPTFRMFFRSRSSGQTRHLSLTCWKCASSIEGLVRSRLSKCIWEPHRERRNWFGTWIPHC